MLDAVGPHLRIDTIRRAPQRELAQGEQVALAEEVLDRTRGLLGKVDLAFLQPLQQVVGREVDQHDVIRVVEYAVGQRLADLDAGDAADDVVQAVEMLDVDRRVDVDAGGEQLLHVLVALRMARSPARWCARARRRAGSTGLRASAASRSNSSSTWSRYSTFLRGSILEAGQQARSLVAAVRLDDAYDDVAPLLRAGAGPRPASRTSSRRRATRRRRSSAGHARHARARPRCGRAARQGRDARRCRSCASASLHASPAPG